MKLLLDNMLSRRVLASLPPEYAGSSHVAMMGLSVAEDVEVWRAAARDGFMIVTKDADFLHLSSRFGSPPKVILLRSRDESAATVARTLEAHRGTIEAFAASDQAVLVIYVEPV